MDERDKIIREDYPVEKLPEDLREGLGDAARVRVTIEAEATRTIAPEERRRRWLEIKAQIDRLRASPNFTPVSTDEAVARVRALRDEWDD